MAGTALEHARLQSPRQQHRCLEVDPQRPGQLLAAEVREAPGGRQARVGDEDVDGAGLGGQSLRRARLGQVGRHRFVAAAGKLARERRQSLRVTAAEDQRRPAAGQRLGDRSAETASGPGE